MTDLTESPIAPWLTTAMSAWRAQFERADRAEKERDLANELHEKASEQRDEAQAEVARLRAMRAELVAVLGRLVNSPVAGTGDYILSERDIEAARALLAIARLDRSGQ